MSTIEAPDVGAGDVDASRVMHRVTAELGEVAAEVARVSAIASPTMELLEAGRAIQSALVSLSNWDGSHDDQAHMGGASTAMLTLSDAWMEFGPRDPWDQVRTTPPDA